MENVGKKQEEDVPKSTPSAPSTAIDRGSRTITEFYTRRNQPIRVEQFQDAMTRHRDPDTSTSNSTPPPPLFSQQEVAAEEEKTYYVTTPSTAIDRSSRTIYKFDNRRTQPIRVEQFQDSMTSHRDPDNSTSSSTPPPPPPLFSQQEVAAEEQKTCYVTTPSTAIDRGSRTISKFYTRRNHPIQVEQFQDLTTSHRDPDTSTSTPPPPLFSQQEVVAEEEKKYYVDWDDYHDWPGFFEDLRKAISEGLFDDIMIDPDKGPDKKVEEKLPDTATGISCETQSDEFVTADEPLNSVKNRTEFENSQSNDAGYIPYKNASTPQGTQSSVITGVGTSDIDNRTSGADYLEKSGIHGSIPAGTETIGHHEQESMHYGPVPGMDTVSEGLQEDAAEVPKQELPVELSGKELDMFHNMKMNR